MSDDEPLPVKSSRKWFTWACDDRVYDGRNLLRASQIESGYFSEWKDVEAWLDKFDLSDEHLTVGIKSSFSLDLNGSNPNAQ